MSTCEVAMCIMLLAVSVTSEYFNSANQVPKKLPSWLIVFKFMFRLNKKKYQIDINCQVHVPLYILTLIKSALR